MYKLIHPAFEHENIQNINEIIFSLFLLICVDSFNKIRWISTHNGIFFTIFSFKNEIPQIDHTKVRFSYFFLLEKNHHERSELWILQQLIRDCQIITFFMPFANCPDVIVNCLTVIQQCYHLMFFSFSQLRFVCVRMKIRPTYFLYTVQLYIPNTVEPLLK